MEHLKVALLQLLPTGSEKENLKKGLEACRQAAAMGADIALFPEMWSTGYEPIEDVNVLRSMATAADGPFVSTFGRLAKELNMAIGITFLEAYDPSPRNSLCLFDRHGERKFVYAKVHTCDFDITERILTPGDDFPVVELDTVNGPVKVGAMICYDREFPESARILMLRGAELILVPNACPMEINRISQLRGRAYENMLGIATCNYPYGQPDCNGHSTAFDGIAYRPNGGGGRDTLILDAGEREGIYVADFPMDAIREYRSREVHGNAWRRPALYSELLSKTVQEPFIREGKRE